MAGLEHRRAFDDDDKFTMRSLWRLSLWGLSAVAAVAVVVLSVQTETGAQRVVTAWNAIRSPGEAFRAQPTRAAPDEGETRRLAEEVRALGADRKRLLARLDTLERTLDDVTGSIAKAPPAAAAPVPDAVLAATGSIPAEAGTPTAAPDGRELGWVASTSQPLPSSEQGGWPDAPAAAENTPASSTVMRTEFGIDVGGAGTISALRALWLSIRSSHPALFEGLRPVVTVREGPRGTTELRLIAGPLGNAGAAARLCGSLAAAGLTCQPAVFDGQRLALR